MDKSYEKCKGCKWVWIAEEGDFICCKEGECKHDPKEEVTNGKI